MKAPLKRRVIVDMPSYLWSALLGGRDDTPLYVEGDSGEKLELNRWEHGYDKVTLVLHDLLETCGASPRDLIMVFEGVGSTLLRKQIFPAYKSGRGKQHPEQYAQYAELCRQVQATFERLGAISCVQDGLEADDIVAYLAHNLQVRSVVASNDGDLAVLSEVADTYIRGVWNRNPYGDFPLHHLPVYKALVGDTSDSIPGAKGFGDKAFMELYAKFGDAGVDVLASLLEKADLSSLAEDAVEMPKLMKVLDQQLQVIQCYRVGKLYPDKVNTLRAPLRWTVGMVSTAPADLPNYLKKWALKRKVVNANNFDAVVSHLEQELPKFRDVSLDIETSTPPESDEWCALTGVGVDVFGSELTGLGLAYGDNHQYAAYFSVDHHGENNIDSAALGEVIINLSQEVSVTVHNSNFELPVLAGEWAGMYPQESGGMLANIDDTKLMASYVNENDKLGLKHLSQQILGYQQVNYAEVTQGRKMNQLTTAEVVAYGIDDVICTSALRNYFEIIMQLEKTWEVYRAVELGAAYLTSHSFLTGASYDAGERTRQVRDDAAKRDAAWAVIRSFLLERGWDGCEPLPFEETAAYAKWFYTLCTGAALDTRVRKWDKLCKFIEIECNEPTLAYALEQASLGNFQPHEAMLRRYFKAEPSFNPDSPDQMAHLLYEVLKLPVRLRNKATPGMRAQGVFEGTPSSNALAFSHALRFDAQVLGEDGTALLQAVSTYRSVMTRFKMFYEPYANLPHWKDRKIHASQNQCATVTRRYSMSAPNLQQLPKGKKGDWRKVFVPHCKDGVILSLDFSGQELRVIADSSQDPNMLSCYVGDDLRDMHSLTAVQIAQSEAGRESMTYAEFIQIYDDAGHPDHAWAVALRKLAKTVNFATEYGAQAPKLAETLLVTEEEAQGYLDAKHSTFSRSEQWKQEVIKQAHKVGYSLTRLGARRHLPALVGGAKWEVAGAERQAVNYVIQGSSAEMTKLAMGRVWQSGVLFDYRAQFIAPIHDEMVFSVHKDDLTEFARKVHALMVQRYGDMQVPIESSISFGLNFADQIEAGDKVDDEKFRTILSSLFPQTEKELAHG